MGRSHKSVIIVIKTFDLKSKFTYHQRTHNGEKPFKYGHCNKTFDLKTNFTFHQKTHIGEKNLNERSVIKVLFKKLILYVIREHTMVKSYVNVANVISLSLKSSLVCHHLMEETVFHWYSD